MAFTKNEIIELYKKRAKYFDITSKLYRLFGFNDIKYRNIAVHKLKISKNDTIVEIGCGTGLNFPIILNKINANIKIIGLDISEAMISQAKIKINNNNWKNVEVLVKEANEYNYSNVNGVISTLAFTLIPEYKKLIQKIATQLPQKSRFVIMDLKLPNHLPFWLIKIFILFAKPFGVTLDLADRKPYEIMKQYFKDFEIEEYFFGILYICVGKK